ncbi:MAG: hypothetical protein H7Z73_10895 [Candidatus Saccharibacteria bacterium]|nr:hypothetical protein [Moraxellaceae bacterium]
MSKIHFILGIEGCGKSLVAPILADYYCHKNDRILCADLNQLAPTFSRFRSLNVTHYNLLDRDCSLNSRKFDLLFEDILKFNGDAIVDTGMDSLHSLLYYMTKNEVLSILQKEGKEAIFHFVLVGGAGLLSSVNILSSILDNFSVPVVVWENEFFGKVVHNGKTFKESLIFNKFQQKIVGVISICGCRASIQSTDLCMMVNEHLTLSEAIVWHKFNPMVQRRFKALQLDFGHHLYAAFC